MPFETWHTELLRLLLQQRASVGRGKFHPWFKTYMSKCRDSLGPVRYGRLEKRYTRARKGESAIIDGFAAAYLIHAFRGAFPAARISRLPDDTKTEVLLPAFTTLLKGCYTLGELQALTQWDGKDVGDILHLLTQASAWLLDLPLEDESQADDVTGQGEDNLDLVATPTALVGKESEQPPASNRRILVGRRFHEQLSRIEVLLRGRQSVNLYGTGAAGKTRLSKELLAQWKGESVMIDGEGADATVEGLSDLFGCTGSTMDSIRREVCASGKLLVLDDYFKIQHADFRKLVGAIIQEGAIPVLIINKSIVAELEHCCVLEKISALENQSEIEQVLAQRLELSGVELDTGQIATFALDAGGHPGLAIAIAMLAKRYPGDKDIAELFKRDTAYTDQRVDGEKLLNRLMDELLNRESAQVRSLLTELSMLPEPWILEDIKRLPSYHQSSFGRLQETGYLIAVGKGHDIDLNPLRELLSRQFQELPLVEQSPFRRVVYDLYHRRMTVADMRSWRYYRILQSYGGEEDRDRTRDILMLIAEKGGKGKRNTAEAHWLTDDGIELFRSLEVESREHVLTRIGDFLAKEAQTETRQRGRALFTEYRNHLVDAGRKEPPIIAIRRLENDYLLYRQSRLAKYAVKLFSDFNDLLADNRNDVLLLYLRVRIGLMTKVDDDIFESLVVLRKQQSGSKQESVWYEASRRLCWYCEKAHALTGSDQYRTQIKTIAGELRNTDHAGWHLEMFYMLVRVCDPQTAVTFARTCLTVGKGFNKTNFINAVLDVTFVYGLKRLTKTWINSETQQLRHTYWVDALKEYPTMDSKDAYQLVDRLYKTHHHQRLVAIVGSFDADAWYANRPAVCERIGHAQFHVGDLNQARLYLMQALRVSNNTAADYRRTANMMYLLNKGLLDICPTDELNGISKILLEYKKSDLWNDTSESKGLTHYFEKANDA